MFVCTRMCAALTLAPFALSGSAESLTEKEILTRFLETSPHTRELRARVAATKAELQTRTLYPNPSFNYSRESAGFTEFFEAQQVLPITGRLGYLRRATDLAAGAGEAESRFLLWGLQSDLRQAFYSLVRAQEREALLKASVDEISGVVRILETREKEGEGSKFDRLRAERERAELRAEQALASALTIQAHSALLSFLPKGSEGITVSGTFSSSLQLTAAELIDRALAVRGDYRATERQVERYRLEQMAAGTLRFPEPVVTAGLKRADISRGNTTAGPVISLSVPIPLFNRGTTEVERFRAEEERARARRETLHRQITAQVEGTYETFLVRQRAAEGYQASLAGGGVELTRIARVAYEEGELGILELLDAYRVNRQAELRLLELRAAAKEAQIELERVVGEEVTK